ncbi:MAG: aminoacyl-tRNA hydrolase [Nocardioides sp.]
MASLSASGPDAGPWLVVGLGNPGPSYAGHRHNVGYRVVDALTPQLGSSAPGGLRAHKSGRAEVFEGRLGVPGQPGPRVIAGRGRSYMNNSGGPVAGLLDFYKVSAERLVVVHDELDLDFGVVRLKLGGGDNGHNGLRSIRSALGTGDFFRIRMGVGRPPGRQDVADFVLSDYRASEATELAVQIERGADAVVSLISLGLERTQNLVHGS